MRYSIQLITAILFASLITSALDLNAQNWFEGQPNWYYEYSTWNCNGETGGHDQVLYKKDTLVDDITMKLFTVKEYRNTLGFEERNETTLILYEVDKRIYEYYNWGEDKLLYDFNHEIGDSIQVNLRLYGPFDICDTLVSYVLDTIEYTTDYSADPLMVQHWRLAKGRSDKEEFTVVEKIGALGEYNIDMNFLEVCGLDICPSYTFNCYYNSALEGAGHSDCRELLSTSEENIPTTPVHIYPNPTNSDLNISSDQTFLEAHIYTTDGLLIRSIELDNTRQSIDLTALESGYYFIKLVDSTTAISLSSFVKI